MRSRVLIVGAGPAGAVAAIVLARAGVRVRLVDRCRFPRDKMCGDTVNPGALALLDRLGVGAGVRARAVPVRGMLVTGPRGAAVTCDYPVGLPGAALRRADLDAVLVEAAVAAGADFVPGLPVAAVFADGHDRVAGVEAGRPPRRHRLPAPLVIAADGRRSRVAAARGLTACARGPRRWAFGAYFSDVGGMTPRGEMHIQAEGYTGLAGLGGGLTNVCVVRAYGDRAIRGTPEQVLLGAIAADARLRERFSRARRVSPVTVLGPLAIDAVAAGCPGLLLAGDAAGFIDPMTGDGLRFAIGGGELAARAALRELETGRPSHGMLTAARRREFAAKWRLNRALRALVGSPRALQLASTVASRWQTPVRVLVGAAGDLGLARRASPAVVTASSR